VPSNRAASLRTALGFLQVAPYATEQRLLHRWLDSRSGLGLVAPALRARAGTFNSRGYLHSVKAPGTRTLRDGGDGQYRDKTIWTRYVCLPDTVDLRGPKAKLVGLRILQSRR
jgi:hypothetical protein